MEGALHEYEDRRKRLSPEMENFSGQEAYISKSHWFFNLLPQAQTLFRVFPNWAPNLSFFVNSLQIYCFFV